MKKPISHLLIILLNILISVSINGQYRPAQALDSLFIDVQLSEIFEDSKTFPDAIPRMSTDSILTQYRLLKHQPGFNLDSFIYDHFTLPKPSLYQVAVKSAQTITEHIDQLWFDLRRIDTSGQLNSKINLPYPYVVPGGRFRELYYWDSYFTMLGLRESGQIEMIQHMVDNFAWLINSYGYVPNGNRSYYLSRSQPPFFAMMVSLLAEIKSDTVLAHYYPVIKKEYNFWMDGQEDLQNQMSYKRVVQLNDSVILNRYWDAESTPRPEAYQEDWTSYQQSNKDSMLYKNIRAACESGWDFSSRWLKDNHSLSTIQTTNIIPVDLNALLYYYELILAECAKMENELQQTIQYQQLAENRKMGILTYCWDSTSHFFTDYHFVEQKTTGKVTLAGMYPLFFNIASHYQAKKTAEKIESYFLYEGGLITSLVLSKQQWDAPNGWAPLQYISISGLENYGFASLASQIANHWLISVEMTFVSDAKMVEKYNVLNPDIESGGGEYPNQDGFGWTNGVYLYLKNQYRNTTY